MPARGTKRPPGTPSPSCAVCQHDDVLMVERLHAAGVPFRVLSERFGIHHQAIFRHWQRHVSQERKASFALGPEQLKDLCATVVQEDGSRLDFLKLLRRYLMSAVTREFEAGNTVAMTSASKALRDVLDDIGRLKGEVLRHHAGFNVTVNQTFYEDPRFALMQSGLIEIGREVPDALPKIIALLKRVDAGPPLIEGSHA